MGVSFFSTSMLLLVHFAGFLQASMYTKEAFESMTSVNEP